MIYPGMPNPSCHIELRDGKNNRGYELILDGNNAVQETSTSEDQSIYFRNVGKKIGDFDEQRNWKGGRGVEFFNDNPEGYWDSENCWTLSAGHLIPSLQWKFAKDLRSCDFSMPGSVAWLALLSDKRYLSRSFTASASYSADKGWLWVRRVGNPGTLTFELCANSSGDPGTVLQTVTKTAANFADVISVLTLFDWTSTESLTASTVYHVKVYGASTDSKTHHWEIATDNSATGKISTTGEALSWSSGNYGMYYRVTDADVSRRWFAWLFDGMMYICDSKDSGSASVLYMNGDRGKATSGASTSITQSAKSWTTDMWAGAYVKIIRGTGAGQVRAIVSNTATALTVAAWDVTPSTDSEYIIYSTDRFTQITGHGLGKVTSCPIVAGGIMYFPQGSTAIRRIRWNAATPAHEFAADSTNTADFLLPVHDPSSGLKIWRALNSTMAVSSAPTAAWGTDLAFSTTTVGVGETNYQITRLEVHNGELYVLKEDSAWSVANNRATLLNIGLRTTPSAYNGAASASHQGFLYMSWLWSVNRMYGGTVDDIGQDWRSKGLPFGREGNVSKLEPAVGWLFAAVDAGSGTSSVLVWDGMSWHEIFRGFSAGRRIRNVFWQPCEGTRSKLWIDIGGELVYMTFPLNKASLLLDTGVTYQHESVITSSIVDMGAASRLSKFIKGLTTYTRNLTSGIEIGVDYQIDDDIESGTWLSAGSIAHSPEEEVEINAGDVRAFQYRLRMNTNNCSTPPDILGVIPNGFARVPWRKVWHVRVKIGNIFALGGRKAIDPDDLRAWLDDAGRYPGRIKMSSVFPTMHDKYVVVMPPAGTPLTPKTSNSESKTVTMISIMEI